jgi:TonB family protein
MEIFVKKLLSGIVATMLSGATLALAQKPLTKAEVDDLISTKANSQHIVKLLEERGTDFEPTDQYLDLLGSKGVDKSVVNALRMAAPAPLTKSAIVSLLKSAAPDDALAAAVRRRGLSFRPSDDDLDDLRVAGAGDLLEAQLQKNRQVMPPPPAGSPNAGSETASSDNKPTDPIYEGGAGVTAPVPTYQPSPPYSLKAARAKVSGVVRLAFVVDTDGSVKDVEVVKGLGYGLDENAVKTVKTWKFKPATRQGLPVKARATIEVTFALDEQHIPTGC